MSRILISVLICNSTHTLKFSTACWMRKKGAMDKSLIYLLWKYTDLNENYHWTKATNINKRMRERNPFELFFFRGQAFTRIFIVWHPYFAILLGYSSLQRSGANIGATWQTSAIGVADDKRFIILHIVMYNCSKICWRRLGIKWENARHQVDGIV